MRIRFLAYALCAVLIFSMFGCVPDVGNTGSTDASTAPPDTSPVQIDGYEVVDPELLDYGTPLYQSVELTKGYDSLDTDAQRKCYKLIEDSVIYISVEPEDGIYKMLPVTLYNSSLSEAELHLIITAFSMDHPEVFWIESGFSYYSTEKLTFLQLSAGMSAQEIIEGARSMDTELQEVFSGLPGNLSQYDRELYIHDTLISRCEYADPALGDDYSFRVYTSLGGIVDSYAVCEGYSRAMQLMLSLVGIETYYVSGIGSDELHMWNTVNLEGSWYYLDATWNDEGDRGADYDHFNLTTDQIQSDHTIGPLYWELTEEEVCDNGSGVAANFNVFVPECTDSDMSYYAHSAVEVTGFDSENTDRIADAIVEAAENGKDAIYLYIDEDYLDYDSAVDNLFYSGDYAIFTCIEQANSKLTDVTVSDDYVSTSDSDTLSVVTVYLEYE